MAAPADAERRLVTVLYADLVGHTELVTRVDPEDWRGLLQQYFATMAQPIHRYGGTVEKFIGDAIFAVFGVPRAHEDDAVRAVRAAVEMQEALARLNPAFAKELGVPLGLRIGIATGEAVAPGETGEDRLVVGDLTTLAERLQRAAPPNATVLSERTHALVGTLVEGEPLGPLDLKGFAGPQQAVLLRRLLPEARPLGAAGVGAPLVNRQRELADLLEAAARVRAGQGQIVFLIGEAGLGKSRLAAELRDRLDPDTRVLVGRCHEFTQGISHGVVLQLLRAYLEIGELDPPEAGRRRLDAGLDRLFGPAAPDARPALEHLLGLDSAHVFEERTRGLEPDDVGAELHRAVTAFWERAALVPTVLLVEDLHWVDAASAGVLARLFEVAERAPLLLLCAFRPERRSAAWELRIAAERDYPHRYREIRLDPLSPDETEQLAAVLLQQLTLPVDLKSSVARRAEGNPLYVEEVVRSLRQGVPGAGPRVPDTLQGVLQARLDALPAATRRILQAASVIGRTFPLRLLRVLSGGNGDLPDHLSALQRTDFLRETQRIPEPSFAFKHVLVQEAAYQTLLRRERRDLHLRLAEALEDEAAGSDTLALLVHHYRQAEAWDRAFSHAVKAGDAALFLGALREAVDQYDVALSIAADRAEVVTDEALLFRTHLARSEALGFLGRYDEAERQLMALLARQPAPGSQAQTHGALGRLRSLQGDLRQARRHLERALHLLESDGDPQEQAAAHRNLAHVLEMKRDYPGALEHAGRAMAIAEAHDLRTQLREVRRILFSIHFYAGDLAQSVRYAEDTLAQALHVNDSLVIIRSRIDLANVLLFKGDVAAALTQAREAVELGTRLRLDVPLILAQTTLAQIYVEQGRVVEAAEIVGAVQALVQQRGLGPRWQAAALRGMASISLARSEWAEAVRQLEEAKAHDERAGIARNLPRIHRLLAEAWVGRADLAAARTHALTVKRLERGGGPIETPAALRVLGVIARERGTLKRAVGLLEESIVLLEPRRQSGEYARTLVELAKTHAGARRRTNARDLFAQGAAIYRTLGAASLAVAVERLATELQVKGEGSR